MIIAYLNRLYQHPISLRTTSSFQENRSSEIDYFLSGVAQGDHDQKVIPGVPSNRNEKAVLMLTGTQNTDKAGVSRISAEAIWPVLSES